MWNSSAYLRLVRVSALYDLLVTVPFATPWSLAWLLRQLDALGQTLGLAPLPVFPPEALLLGNLLGSVVCVWSVLRLARPSLLLGRHDAVARGLFALWMAWALSQGASPLLMAFLVVEIGFGIAQAWPVSPAIRHAQAQLAC
ncbi:hypothetical protein [Pseudomonas oryzihabitans]|uniref:hypothetical protein n=1 Tax=Pseudomonas oryzihabitans TaxID=47885 RepID=UPI00111CF2F0|nr:hypothetical protein [Pseudomonas psychrotolerans]MDR6676811.1 hypothetical protein [Pseudomonas psychrotolerans]QDD90481.1 hypothetical protein CCZ28_16225 [Pseudomonas psychrotolerans]